LIVRKQSLLTEQGVADYGMARGWGHEQAALIVKGAVSGPTSDDVGSGAAGREFFDVAREASVPGRLSGLRRVPFHVRLTAMTAGAQSYWVGEAAPKTL